jgi:phospholipid-binding lipoprotein MlaA
MPAVDHSGLTLPQGRASSPPWTASSLLPLLTASFLLIGGCATVPPGSERDPRDHFERFNRTMFKFDISLDHAVLRPVARGYVKVTPSPVRAGISNFLGNLAYTTTLVNDVLQGRAKDFGRDLARLIVNTTLGIGGLFDPASHLGLLRHDRDFGQTLGRWGVHTGSYLVLPFLGPSDVRDAFGTVADGFTTIDRQVDDTSFRYGVFGMRTVDDRASVLPTDSILDSAYDPYAFARSAWFQHRAYKVHGGDPNYLPNLPPDPDDPE